MPPRNDGGVEVLPSLRDHIMVEAIHCSLDVIYDIPVETKD